MLTKGRTRSGPMRDVCIVAEPTNTGRWTVYVYSGDHRVELVTVDEIETAERITTLFATATEAARAVLT
jgi:hypothetical protein